MNRLPSTPRIAHRIGRRVGALLAVSLIGLGGGNATATQAPIYKCLDRNLGVVYTDIPCKDGERMDVRAGDADPAAMARLERERDALDRSITQRITDQRRAALQRTYAPAPDYYAGYDEHSGNDTGNYAPYGGYGYLAGAPAARPRPAGARNDHRNVRQRPVVPNRMVAPPR
ncbi:MAG: hypothetical protein ABI569_00790 [Casimicrobiaceae bacterium]